MGNSAKAGRMKIESLRFNSCESVTKIVCMCMIYSSRAVKGIIIYILFYVYVTRKPRICTKLQPILLFKCNIICHSL